MKSKIVLSSIATLALISFVGCGGGSTPGEVDTGTTSAKISGIADDDLILNGVVTATDASGAPLGEGRTSTTDGSYALNVAHTGIVLVNVTCQDGNSTMWNPATPIAEAVACGSEVTLNSLANVEAGVDQTVHISPLTEIVYQRAEEQAGGDISAVTATEFDDARDEVGLLFGVDPIADSPIEGTSAAIIDAIHTLADEDNTTSVIDITEALAAELADGTADGSADATVSALTTVMDDANLTNNLTDNNGTYIPPENPAALSDIDEAKELFTELRTQAMSVVDYDNSGTPGFLDTEAQSMDAALNGVAMNIGVMGDFLNYIADDIGYMLENSLTNYSVITETSPGNWAYSFGDGTQKWSGTVSIPAVLLGDNAEAELYTAGTLTMVVNGTTPLTHDGLVEEGVTDSQSFEGEISVTKTTSGADLSISGSVASNGTTIQLTEANAELAYTEGTTDEFGNTEPVLNYFKLHNIIIQGVVGGYTIDGSITINNYVQNTGLADKGGIYEVAESGFSVYFGCSDYSPVNVSGVTFDYDGITYQPSGYSNTNFWFDSIAGDVQYNDILTNLDYTASCVSGQVTSSIYNWNDNNIEIANSGWLPSDITFAGAISRTGAAMEGTLNAKWLNAATMDLDSNETPLVDVRFDGKLQMPERPEMLATLTFENSATNNTLGASYTYGTTVINMSALFDTEMDNGDVEVTTHTGLRADLKITDGSLVTDGTSKVTKDGSLVGTFEDREDVPVIKYIDGSFESLL